MFEGKDYAASEEVILTDEKVAALGDSVEEIAGAHQLGEKPVSDQKQVDQAAAGDVTTKGVAAAPKDTQVKNAPAKK